MFTKYLRLYHTLKYLKPIQIYRRLWLKVYRPKVAAPQNVSPRSLKNSWAPPVEKAQSMFGRWQFRFLNVAHNCRFPADWNSGSLEKLWLYNLHYFEYLGSRASAEKTAIQRELIDKWIDENPPGYGNGWEPYPISLRIVNWIKWALQGNRLTQKALQSLSLQAAYLEKRLEYHLLGNHLFANGKALVFAGLFFQGPEAERWLRQGMLILEKEVAEQVLADGGHFERSPMYHSIILEDLLDLCNIFRTYGVEFPHSWVGVMGKMTVWLVHMRHPDGRIALFNDAAFAIAAEPSDIFGYVRRLGFAAMEDKEDGLKIFEESGYGVYRQNDVAALFDVGRIGPDYLPGHAHADTLSFELSCFGRRVVVDSGTSCYGISEERLRQRKTVSHNTVVIDGEDSSEVWSGFRVARRAYPFGLQVEEDGDVVSVSCCHDGYRRLKGNVIHCRKWEFTQGAMTITDSLQGEYKEACSFLHLHPDVSVAEKGERWCVLNLASGGLVKVEVEGGSLTCGNSTYHPEFGLSLSNTRLQIRLVDATCRTTITWE